MQVSPQEKICIAALISDPADTNTYYVQAVMRDTLTNKILGSVKLAVDPNNSRRFFGYLEAPSNNTPTGRYINITTSIYTNAGYSVYSQNYEEVVASYIVAQRWSMALAGGAGGVDLYAPDYAKAIREAMKDYIEPVFGRISKLLNGRQSAVKVKADTASEARIIEAVRGAQKPTAAMQKQLASFETAMGDIVARIDKNTGMSKDMRADLKDALSKVNDAAETIMGSYVYSSLASVPMPHPQKKQKTAEDLMREEHDEQGNRGPTKGVVPAHILARRIAPKSSAQSIMAPVPRMKMPPRSPIASMRDSRSEDGQRVPSPGIVPLHVIARNKKGLKQAGIL